MGLIFVFIQFLSLILLVLSGPFLPQNLASLFLYIAGGILGTFALAAMRRSKIKVSPSVHPDAKLVTYGIYRFIRHPMYLAVMLGATGMLLNQVTILRTVILVILCLDLAVKMVYEEVLLFREFGEEYKVYMQKTKRIIPFII